MVAPDPVDIRLLSLVAESGKAAVHDIAARLGMDPREVASRLVALSATGLPLIVGVECDPYAVRTAIAPWLAYLQQTGAAMPAGMPQGAPMPPQGGSGPYPPPQGSGPYPPPQGGSGPYAQPQSGSGPYPQPQGGSGPYPPPRYGPPGGPSGPYPAPGPVPAQQPRPAPRPVPGTQSAPAPAQDPMATWGPPQSSSWARGDQPTRPATWTPPPAGQAATPGVDSGGAAGPVEQRGQVGETLIADADGEQLAIQLVEVVDPADFLFTAAGYRLREGERSVVVHTELTNRGSAPFPQLPDLYLVLVAKDGQTVGKAPVSLSSRPPHRIGVRPGETTGGHTVYVLPETTEITSVRWTVRPEDERSLTWAVES